MSKAYAFLFLCIVLLPNVGAKGKPTEVITTDPAKHALPEYVVRPGWTRSQIATGALGASSVGLLGLKLYLDNTIATLEREKEQLEYDALAHSRDSYPHLFMVHELEQKIAQQKRIARIVTGLLVASGVATLGAGYFAYRDVSTVRTRPFGHYAPPEDMHKDVDTNKRWLHAKKYEEKPNNLDAIRDDILNFQEGDGKNIQQMSYYFSLSKNQYDVQIGDGRCFFHSITTALGKPVSETASVKKDLIAFLDAQPTLAENFGVNHINELSMDSWGDEPHIAIASKALNRVIIVSAVQGYTKDGSAVFKPISIYRPENVPQLDELPKGFKQAEPGPPIWLAFTGGHYNLIVPDGSSDGEGLSFRTAVSSAGSGLLFSTKAEKKPKKAKAKKKKK